MVDLSDAVDVLPVVSCRSSAGNALQISEGWFRGLNRKRKARTTSQAY